MRRERNEQLRFLCSNLLVGKRLHVFDGVGAKVVQGVHQPESRKMLSNRDRRGTMKIKALVAAIALVPLLAVPARSQSSDLTHASRSDLEARLDSLQTLLSGWQGDADEKRRLRARAAAIEKRLEEGDFRTGSVVRVRVLGDTALSGIYTLDENATLRMSGLDAVSLEGLLLSEAQPVLRDSLSKYLRDPQVRIEPLRRVGVLGAVNNPGFYELPPDATVADALMKAGGLSQDAEVEEIKRGRDGDEIAPAGESVSSITLRGAGVGSGDELYVPKGGGFTDILGPVLGVAASLTLIITRL